MAALWIRIKLMKPFQWSAEKNHQLKHDRGISFERVTVAVESGGLLDVVSHPNPTKYPNQRVLIVAIDAYAFLVPFVDEPEHYFLKTIIPSRKATREYLRKDTPDHEN